MADASIDCERVDRLERRTLVVRGEIDLVSAAEFRANLDALLHEARSPGYVDLSEVTFMDSSAVGALIAASQSAPSGKRLVLLDPSPVCDLVFTALGLDEIFEIFRS